MVGCLRYGYLSDYRGVSPRCINCTVVLEYKVIAMPLVYCNHFPASDNQREHPFDFTMSSDTGSGALSAFEVALNDVCVAYLQAAYRG